MEHLDGGLTSAIIESAFGQGREADLFSRTFFENDRFGKIVYKFG
jgi:hypothetical protein